MKTRDGKLIYESADIHTSLLRLEIVADSLKITTPVANAAIDRVNMYTLGSQQTATVTVTNIDL